MNVIALRSALLFVVFDVWWMSVGTALGVIFECHAQMKGIHVWVDETRPRVQGARLTAWELMNAKVPM